MKVKLLATIISLLFEKKAKGITKNILIPKLNIINTGCDKKNSLINETNKNYTKSIIRKKKIFINRKNK
jgi:hypothetical protein